MNPEDKEALSAWLDGESAPLEERRLLRDHEALALLPSIAGWQEIGDALRGERSSALSVAERREQFNMISKAIRRVAKDTEDKSTVAPQQPSRTAFRSRWFSAVASVAAVAVVGILMLDGLTPRTESTLTAAAPEPTRVEQPLILAGAEPTVMSDALRSNPELKALDDASRARLRAYLKQHDRLSHLATQQRLVSYPNAGTSDQ